MTQTYKPVSLVNVSILFDKKPFSVGRLALSDGKVYFEYDSDFLSKGLEISPIKLPLKNGLQSFDPMLPNKIAGVFSDSLPDGWGRLLLDRALRAKGINQKNFSVLDSLAYVGENGMGALIYHPNRSETDKKSEEVNLDTLSYEAEAILKGKYDALFEKLLALNGSSAGARPKALIGVNKDKSKIIHGVKNLKKEYEHWIVKFSNTSDGKEAGAIEYVYSQMAKIAGLDMPKTHLFETKKNGRHFAIKRFDRINNQRFHMVSASGLLNINFRVPSLDYQDLIALTATLTKDMREVKKMYRLSLFNVLSHNQDDHGKNFSFLMNEFGEWKLSPAYDITYSNGPGTEQSTMVMGVGKNITDKHLLNLAHTAGIKEVNAKAMIEQTKEALSNWQKLATNVGISKSKINEIKKVFKV